MQTGWEVVGTEKRGQRVRLGEARTQQGAMALASSFATPITHGTGTFLNYGTPIVQMLPNDVQMYYGSYFDIEQKPAYGIRRVNAEQWDVIQADENVDLVSNEPVVVSSHPDWHMASTAAVLKINGINLPEDNLDSECTD